MKQIYPLTLAVLLLSLLTTLTATAQTYQPILLTGFNHDVIANGKAILSLATSTSVDNSGYVLYEQGYSGCGEVPPYGLPTNRILANSATPELTYTLADYSANNVLLLYSPTPNTTSSGTLTFGLQQRYSKLAILTVGTEGNPSVTVSVHFKDGTSSTFTGIAQDWYEGYFGFAVGIGRITRTTCQADGSEVSPHLYSYDFFLAPAEQNKIIESISFSKAGGDLKRLLVFAFSGIPNSSSCTFTPGITTSNTAQGRLVQLSGGVKYERLFAPQVVGGVTYQFGESNTSGSFIIPVSESYRITATDINGCQAVVTGPN